MTRNALIAALAGLGLVGGVAVGVSASPGDQPTPIIAAGVSSSSEEPTTTTTVTKASGDAPAPDTTTTTERRREETTSTTRPAAEHRDEPLPTTTTTEVHREPTTTTTEVHREPTTTTMEIACGVPDHEFGIVCEWTDAPDRANHLVLLRRTRETDLEPIWRTDDMSVHRHVDSTVEPGGGYGYQVRAYDGDLLVAVSNTATREAPRPAPAPATSLRLACATPANDGGPASVVCEWSDPPDGADHWVLMRELSGPSQPIWGTEDMSVRRYVDDTAEMGTSYSYRISAYHGDQYLGTSNPVRITAGGKG